MLLDLGLHQEELPTVVWVHIYHCLIFPRSTVTTLPVGVSVITVILLPESKYAVVPLIFAVAL